MLTAKNWKLSFFSRHFRRTGWTWPTFCQSQRTGAGRTWSGRRTVWCGCCCRGRRDRGYRWDFLWWTTALCRAADTRHRPLAKVETTSGQRTSSTGSRGSTTAAGAGLSAGRRRSTGARPWKRATTLPRPTHIPYSDPGQVTWRSAGSRSCGTTTIAEPIPRQTTSYGDDVTIILLPKINECMCVFIKY